MIEFLLSVLAVLLVLLPLWSVLRLNDLTRQHRSLQQRLAELETEVSTLRPHVAPPTPPAAQPQAAVPLVPPLPPALNRAGPAVPPVATSLAPSSRPPTVVAPPPRPATQGGYSADWERFMGAKLFAWLGGLAAFLGAAFFVKYSFEHQLIPPAIRVAIGFLFALSLVIGGLAIPRPRFAITAQTLIATGIVSLYAVTYACNAYYHFEAFGPATTFAVMVLVTVAAFLLAVRLNARVVAVLGMLGGFLTPVLLSTGENRALALFAYIGLLDAGLLTVAVRRRWQFLFPLAALGTVFIAAMWTGKFFDRETSPTLVITTGAFAGLFLIGHFAQRRFRADDGEAIAATLWSSAGIAFAGYLLALAFVGLPGAEASVPLLCTSIFLSNAAILVLGWTVVPVPGESRRVRVSEWLSGLALLGTALVEHAWYARHRPLATPITWLWWYAAFYVLFAAYPFVFWRRFIGSTATWAVAALAGVIQFPLVYELIRHAWPAIPPGLIPAAFAVPAFASVATVAQLSPANSRARLNQLAWFAGIGLLFITLIIPLQLHRQWITLGWALEGAALLALFHRLPHRGIQAAGVVLLVVAFARLAVNPAVLEYHSRGEVPLLNWYLYTYGVVIAALFAGARLAHAPRNRLFDLDVVPLLYGLAIILTFLLLNIEIADFFSPVGQSALTFQFRGNFARDMTYTIAWALFALVLLLVSIGRDVRGGRYGALALLGVTTLKLFLHDLARLDALYRIGALFAVAVIAIAASVAYQRFLPNGTRQH